MALLIRLISASSTRVASTCTSGIGSWISMPHLPLGGHSLQLLDRLLDQRAQREPPALGRLLAPLGDRQGVDVVRHPLDALHRVAQVAQRPLAGGLVRPVARQQVEGRLGRAQPVAQLVGQVAAEAAQQARPLPAVPETLLPEGGGGDGGDRHQRPVEALGDLDGVAGRHLAAEALGPLPSGP